MTPHYLELYREKEGRRGFTNIEVLPFLKGREVDKIVKGYLHALRPSKVEIVPHPGMFQCDSCLWRVRVFLDENQKICEITQEVQVGLYDNIQNGSHLWSELNNQPEHGPVVMDAKAIARIDIK